MNQPIHVLQVMGILNQGGAEKMIHITLHK